MATLTTIIERFKTLVDASTTINTFVFDDLTSVNIDRAKSYPLLLLKPDESTIDNVTKTTGAYETYKLRMYVMDTYFQAEQSTTPQYQKWDNLKQIGVDFIQSLQDRETYKMLNTNIKTTVGHFQHNDDLMVVAFDFELTVHNCY